LIFALLLPLLHFNRVRSIQRCQCEAAASIIFLKSPFHKFILKSSFDQLIHYFFIF
jgi:hypothetical protein